MSRNIWLNKKPESNFDWLILIFAAIAFYVLMGHVDLFVGGVGVLLGVLSPFAGGIVIAYILDAIIRPVQKKLFRGNPRMRWASILIAYVVAVLVILLLLWLVIPQVFSSINMLFANLPYYINNVQETLVYIQNRYAVDLTRAIAALDDYELLMKELYDFISGWFPQILSYVGGMASNAVGIFTALASSVYMLFDKEKLLRQLRTMTRAFLPATAAESTLSICSFANSNFSGFFIGKIIDSIIIGVLTFICMAVLRLSFTPLISVFVGITNIIPVFGPFIGAIPGIIILLFVSPFQALEFTILILVIQQLDGNFIGPKILGQSIGISALWVLFSIVLGGDLFGLVGMVLGVPVFATCYGLLRGFVKNCLDRKGIDADGNPLKPDAPEGEAGPAPQAVPASKEPTHV